MAHLVLEKVPVLNSTGNIPQEEDVTSMKVEFKMSSKVRLHLKEYSCGMTFNAMHGGEN